MADPLQTIIASLGQLQNVDAHVPALLDGLRADVVEDNRSGILAQLDKDGVPMRDVTYRTGAGKPTKPRKGNRYGAQTLGHYLGPELTLGHVVLAAAPANGNLTSAQYKKLTGPALAPRGPRSRVIANLLTEWFPDGAGAWIVVGRWVNVVSAEGVPILEAHFLGKATGRNHAAKLPVRDLRGVRPKGMERAGKRAKDWAETLIAKVLP